MSQKEPLVHLKQKSWANCSQRSLCYVENELQMSHNSWDKIQSQMVMFKINFTSRINGSSWLWGRRMNERCLLCLAIEPNARIWMTERNNSKSFFAWHAKFSFSWTRQLDIGLGLIRELCLLGFSCTASHFKITFITPFLLSRGNYFFCLKGCVTNILSERAFFFQFLHFILLGSILSYPLMTTWVDSIFT